MKAAVFNGNELVIKEVAKPQISEDQTLINVKAAGICGTDIAIVTGHLVTPTPLILGHEFAGEVVEVGKKVDQSWIGKRVTSEINSNIDFNCYFCDRKQYTQCISRKALGIDIDGAFAEYIAVESYLLHEIPENISFEEGTFIEPLAAAYQTFEMMPLDHNDKIVAVFGLGKLGLLITQVALLLGLNVIVVDGSTKKLALANKLGSHFQINRFNCKSVSDKIKSITSGLGADIVIDSTGNPEALNDIINSCRTRGKVHIKSTHGMDTPVNLTDMVVRELTFYSSRCGPFEKAIEGLKSNIINVKDLISKTIQINDIREFFISGKEDRDHIKIIILI
ncbi:hypothetical protein LCGC14_2139600 [marine sediment metagenome]|uniref:Enoyl reductase (ER) domain-containing protein n=1 Tax=marine sediment metagenome TaxID=412755 RepID=A0A0F9GV44_9ZZZZ